MTSEPIGLYIHIPFCESKCSYCDFNTYARLEWLIPSYIEALETEIRLWGDRLGHPPARTVFFGGGTPSWLPAEAISRVLGASRSAFPFPPDAEVTAEANPGDVTPERLERWMEMGINRISIGVQSFDDDLLKLLTRRHTAAEAAQAFGLAQRAGFQSVSIDLMYGLPTQSMAAWRDTLQQAVGLGPPHVSMYALTVEEGTPLWSEVRKGSIPKPDPDMAAEMYVAAEEMLGGAGYRHYEISNWARPGHECRHNLIYWRNEPFLGVGPGAHSYLGKERFWNIKSPTDYVNRLAGPLAQDERAPGESPVIQERQPLGEAQELSETLILRLRLDDGVDPAWLAQRFGEDPVQPRLETLRRFEESGLLSRENGVFRLTSQGRLLSNEIFVKLLPQS